MGPGVATGCIPAGTGGNHGQLSMRNSWAPCAFPDKCSWDSRAVTEKGLEPGGEGGGCAHTGRTATSQGLPWGTHLHLLHL